MVDDYETQLNEAEERILQLEAENQRLKKAINHAREVLIDYGNNNPQIERVLQEARLKLPSKQKMEGRDNG